ncbi:glycosyltransferase family 2 protein [Bacteroidota bacterium]
MVNDNPLVTVNILSFNRKEELRNTLTKVYEQDYKNIEVIVVDNASEDGSPEMVENDFPDVKLIRLEKNIGIAGWNRGFEIAKGEYILVLDDDSYPVKNTISHGIKYFDYEKIGIIALSIYNNYLQLYETENYDEYPLGFIGCGALIKRKVFDDVGYYDENIFLYHNELDFSLRTLDRDWLLFIANDAKVIHNYSSESRFAQSKNLLCTGFRYENYFKSMWIVIWKNTNGFMRVWLLSKWMINRIIIALCWGYWSEFLRALRFNYSIISKMNEKNNFVKYPIQKRFSKVIKIIDRDYFRRPIKTLKNILFLK